MTFTQDFRTQRRNYNDGDTRIGEKDRLWYDSNTNSIRISDGETPGGVAVGGAGGSDYVLPTASTTIKGGVKVDGTTITISNQVISGFSGNYNDLTNKPVLFDGTYNSLSGKPTLFDPADITQTLTPRTDVSIDLGTESKRWRDLYLSGNTIFLGTAAISRNNAGGVDLPVNSRVNGKKIAEDVSELTDSGNLLSRGTSDYRDLTNKPVKTVTLYQDGTLQVTTGTVRWYNPNPLEIDRVIVRLASAADQTVTVVIKKSNTTFRTIEVSANSTKVVVNNLNLEMVDDDFLTVDVTTVGNTAKGSGLSVEFFYTMV
jgi:hypothetical protein